MDTSKIVEGGEQVESALHYIQFNEIGITFAVIVAAMTFVVLTWNAVKAILDWRALAKKPTADTIADHEERIARLEECCAEVRGKLESDFQWQRAADEKNTLILRSIKHLMQHALDGNDTQKLKEMEQEIDDYLFTHQR